ncbi:MAG: hypothetical protein JNG88_04515 [Phycisphaerales bacterium]|nr:hypothetical protein [Phycisphaerales bacterium]
MSDEQPIEIIDNAGVIQDRALFDRYVAFRQALKAKLELILGSIGRQSLVRSAERLGIWRQGRIDSEREDSVIAMVDLALFESEAPRSVIQNFIEMHPPAAGDAADEAVSAAMLQSRLRIVRFDERRSDGLMPFMDVIGEESGLMLDSQLCQMNPAKLCLLSRLVPFEGYYISSGCALPMEHEDLKQLILYLCEFNIVQIRRNGKLHIAPGRRNAMEFAVRSMRTVLLPGATVGDRGEERQGWDFR